MIMKGDTGGLGHLMAFTFLYNLSSFMVVPAITDVTLAALCPGLDRCSLAIYLTGFQQAITGLGAVVVTPVVGNLSDKYGRKALLTLPTTFAILPLAILAYNRTKTYFYAYYAIKMFSGIFSEGSLQCLSLAYVADKVCEGRRASAIAVVSGVSTAGFVSGSLAARFLSTSSTFQVSAALAVVAAAYMRVFLPDSDGGYDLADAPSSQPLCSSPSDGGSAPRLPLLRKAPSLGEVVGLLTSSLSLSRAAVVAFFQSLGDSGLQTALLYFLKAQFHFNKDQFADLLLIFGIAGTFSQLILMPLIAPRLGEEKLLNIGLLASCTHVFLYSIAWAYWVPYFAASFVVLSIFVQPCIRSIVSKTVGPSEQGLAQGCLTGVTSFASIISPLAFTPLTAWFLSEDAPFSFKGFSLMCVAFSMLIALTMSITMRVKTAPTCQNVANVRHEQA